MIHSFIAKISCLFLLFSFQITAQKKNCDLTIVHNGNITLVNTEDVRCLARNSTKDKILLFSFGMWCAPCIEHLPSAIKLSQDYDLELFILLVDKEDESELLERSIKYLRSKKSDINIVLVKDYKNKKRTGKYINFLKEITPNRFENLNDMSKYIILNKAGEVILMTTWKDNRENDWKDDSKMIEKVIVPVLKAN